MVQKYEITVCLPSFSTFGAPFLKAYMQIIEQARALSAALKNLKNPFNLGFVPTMGNLHQGHISLVENSVKHNDYTVVSIYVNKRQFNDINDFNAYPKTLASDIKLLEKFDNLILYVPESEKELFPPDFDKIVLDLGEIDKNLEGAYRPGHFKGVIEVVHQLFSQVKPSNAYFGLKDFQQVAVVKKLAEKYFTDLTIIAVETSRENSGLALSSRNERLSENDKKLAAEISKSLKIIAENFSHKNNDVVIEEQHRLKKLGFEIDYLCVANESTLVPTTKFQENTKQRVFAAIMLSGVRLIDNMPIKA